MPLCVAQGPLCVPLCCRCCAPAGAAVVTAGAAGNGWAAEQQLAGVSVPRVLGRWGAGGKGQAYMYATFFMQLPVVCAGYS